MIFAIASMLAWMEVGGTPLASRQPSFFAPPANVLGLSIEEKDLLFCTRIGRWPLPLPSYLCNPANALGPSIEENDLLQMAH